jgi:hypothetical protein
MVLRLDMTIQTILLLNVVKEGGNEVWDKRYSHNWGLSDQMEGGKTANVAMMFQRCLQDGMIGERAAAGQHAVSS